MQTGPESPGIEFRGVSKRLQLREGATLREFLLAIFKGQGWSEPFHAPKDVTFSIARGDTVGIIGRNGSGKSTLLKLVAGAMAPTAGDVRISGRVSPLIELGAGFHPDLTGGENIILNGCILDMSGKEVRERFGDIVAFAELRDFIDTPVKCYSSGMYMRLGFSVAVHSDPGVLMVDEVLAVGDAHCQEKCLAKMHEFQSQGVTIILVSHSTELVERFCQCAMLIDGGRLLEEGSPQAVIPRYLEMVDHLPEMAV